MISANNDLWKNNVFNIYNKNLLPVSIGNVPNALDEGMLNLVKQNNDGIHTETLLTINRSTTATPGAGLGSSIVFRTQTADNNLTSAGSISSFADDASASNDNHTLKLQVYQNSGSSGPQFKLNREGAFVGEENNRHFLRIFADASSLSGGLQVSANTPAPTLFGPAVYFNTTAHDWAMYAANTGAFIGSHKYAIRNINKAKDYLVIDSLGRVGIGNTNQTAARLYSEHPSATESAIYGANTTGTAITGSGVTGVKGLAGNGGYAVYGESSGTSAAGYFLSQSNTAVTGISSTGSAGIFEITNTSATTPAVQILNAGQHAGLNIGTSNSLSVDPAVIINTVAKGRGISLNMLNSAGTGEGIFINKFGPGTGLFVNEHDGKAAEFTIVGSSNTNTAMEINNAGTGRAADFSSTNSNTVLPVARFTQSGKGGAIRVIDLNPSSSSPAAFISSQSIKAVEAYADSIAVEGTSLSLTGGVALNGVAVGTNGIGVKGQSGVTLENAGAVTGINTGNGIAVYGKTSVGFGTNDAVAIKGEATGSGLLANAVGVLGIVPNGGIGVKGVTGTGGVGIYGIADTSCTEGFAGVFTVYNSANTSDAVSIGSAGSGTSLHIDNINTSTNNTAFELECNGPGQAMFLWAKSASNGTLATFRKNGTGDFTVYEDNAGANKIRFDHTGKGFFNGGTQNSGADIAEAFDVTGNRNEYEPGDVLVISVDKDRTVEKSAQPYSALVAGVYATKPGVLLTGENIDTDISGKVPMGVVGVIPTKVCTEGGEIKRGDLLVTSSLPGVAMKADMEKIKPGQVIGKALENFNSAAAGSINVLVNVK